MGRFRDVSENGQDPADSSVTFAGFLTPDVSSSHRRISASFAKPSGHVTMRLVLDKNRGRDVRKNDRWIARTRAKAIKRGVQDGEYPSYSLTTCKRCQAFGGTSAWPDEVGVLKSRHGLAAGVPGHSCFTPLVWGSYSASYKQRKKVISRLRTSCRGSRSTALSSNRAPMRSTAF